MAHPHYKIEQLFYTWPLVKNLAINRNGTKWTKWKKKSKQIRCIGNVERMDDDADDNQCISIYISYAWHCMCPKCGMVEMKMFLWPKKSFVNSTTIYHSQFLHGNILDYNFVFVFFLVFTCHTWIMLFNAMHSYDRFIEIFDDTSLIKEDMNFSCTTHWIRVYCYCC